LVEVGGCGGKNGAETRQQFSENIFCAKMAGICAWFRMGARVYWHFFGVEIRAKKGGV
jgi:hypothetical protein